MKVFISWSGPRSRKTAQLLREWLPYLNQEIEPFVSQDDISKGGDWSQAIISALDGADFGIVCVTPNNQAKPWLLFEAGAMSRQVNNEPTKVAPLLIGFEGRQDLPPPLGRFQTTLPNQEDMYRLVASLNGECKTPRDATTLKKAFDKWWDDFDGPFREIEASSPSSRAPRRSDSDVLAEVLDVVRSLQQQQRQGQVASVNAWTSALKTRPDLTLKDIRNGRSGWIIRKFDPTAFSQTTLDQIKDLGYELVVTSVGAARDPFMTVELYRPRDHFSDADDGLSAILVKSGLTADDLDPIVD